MAISTRSDEHHKTGKMNRQRSPHRPCGTARDDGDASLRRAAELSCGNLTRSDEYHKTGKMNRQRSPHRPCVAVRDDGCAALRSRSNHLGLFEFRGATHLDQGENSRYSPLEPSSLKVCHCEGQRCCPVAIPDACVNSAVATIPAASPGANQWN